MTMAATTYGSPALAVFGSHGIRLSGITSYDVSDNVINSTTYAGIFLTGGDLAFEFAEPIERYTAFRDCRVVGNTLKNSNGGFSIVADFAADNLYDAADKIHRSRNIPTARSIC